MSLEPGPMDLFPISRIADLSRVAYCPPRLASAFAMVLLALEYPGKKGDIYNILWALVFGFATLNILGLVARRFEPNRSA